MATKKRLIDANELLRIYKKWIPQLILPQDQKDKEAIETCIKVLEDQPAVDAVEVVRCKDCEHYEPFNIRPFVGECYVWSAAVKESGFCHQGERKAE